MEIAAGQLKQSFNEAPANSPGNAVEGSTDVYKQVGLQ